jgi:hypothetical protein
MTTRAEILREFKVDKHGIIKTLGKFEGEMLYAPYFYEFIMEGGSDETDYDENDNAIDYFDVSADDLKEFPELEGVKRLACYEDDNGFFFCREE